MSHVPVLPAELKGLRPLRTANALAWRGGRGLAAQRGANRFPRTSWRGGPDRSA